MNISLNNLIFLIFFVFNKAIEGDIVYYNLPNEDKKSLQKVQRMTQDFKKGIATSCEGYFPSPPPAGNVRLPSLHHSQASSMSGRRGSAPSP